MKIHKVDFNYIEEEAKRIEVTDTGGINWLKKFDEGETIARLLPPYNARGRLFCKVVKHWSLPPENAILLCLDAMWPEESMQCPTCIALDRIQSKFPKLDLWRQSPSVQYNGNIIIRGREDEGVFTPNFTEYMYNWIMREMRKPQVGDVTDIEKGFDLSITKTMKPDKNGKKRTSYSLSWCPRPVPLSDDDEKIALWLSSLPDLDKIYQVPSDEYIEKSSKIANAMFAHYVTRYGGNQSTSYPPTQQVQTVPSTVQQSYPTQQMQSSPQQSVQQQQMQTTPAQQVQSHPSQPLSATDPTAYPPCFAGLDNPEPHAAGPGVDEVAVGTIGMSEYLQKCLVCPYDVECEDHARSKGMKAQ